LIEGQVFNDYPAQDFVLILDSLAINEEGLMLLKR